MTNPKEILIFDGRKVFLEWIESDSISSDINISQVTGYCVDDDGKILIIKNERGWTFPGGHPETGETPEVTLHREVAEEACVSVKNPKLIGYVEVKDPGNESIEGTHYIQLRYLAKIDKISDFKKEFEILERNFVDINSLSQYVPWITSPTGKGQLDTLLKNFIKKF